MEIVVVMLMILIVHVVEEHSMLLGKELINVFGPDVVIIFDVGAGEMMKAALVMRILSIAIVPNKAHKEFVLEILRKFVAAMNLVNLNSDLPTKTAAMLKFEATHPDNGDVKRALKATALMQADCA